MHLLEKSIRFTVEEMCLKMGMMLPGVRLNYPAKTLCRMLNTDFDSLHGALKCFAVSLDERFGAMAVEPFEGGFCFAISQPAVASMLHEPIGGDFLPAAAALSADHHASPDMWKAVFDRFGTARLLPAEDPEYDYLLYYPSGQPVSFIYCLKRDGTHLTCHRLEAADFSELYGDKLIEQHRD